MTAILIATRNAHKVSEIQAILGKEFQYLTLSDFPRAPKVIEDADTFGGNATKKAVELANWLAARNAQPIPDLVLADDSGLEVDALDGAPGVFSARFAAMDSADNSSDADNNAKLLRLLKDVPQEKRTARFRCVIALTPVRAKEPESASRVCYADESELQTQLFDGVCEGRIILEPHGTNGFGYDPLFVPDGFDKTFADLGDDVKNKLSHRAQALEKLKSNVEALKR